MTPGGWMPLRTLRTTFKARRIYPQNSPCLEVIRNASTKALPPMIAQREDGLEKPIREDDLFQHTRFRWLTNDSQECARRYLRFNVHALIDAAIDASGQSASSCTRIFKYPDGLNNKVFILTLDNGSEVLARLSTPNAGPAFYTNASEVATRGFLRSILNIPVPKICSYALDAANPVGAEFILEERAHGTPLDSLWSEWDVDARKSVLDEIVDIETKLTSVSFQKHGCIYYKKHLKEKGIPAYDLGIGASQGFDNEVDTGLQEEFALGPLTEARLWADERENMDLDRGPYSNPLHYVGKLGLNELLWAEAHAKPQINPYRSLDLSVAPPVSPVEYISLLDRFCQLALHLPLPDQQKTLSHPSLTLDKIFIDPETRKVTSIIGWQSASVSEGLFQHPVPSMLLPMRYGPRVSADHTGPTGDKSFDAYREEVEELMNYYATQTLRKNRQRDLDLHPPNRNLLLAPIYHVTGAWSRNEVFPLLHGVVGIAAHWEKIVADAQASMSDECPIDFSQEEKDAFWQELEARDPVEKVVRMLHDQGAIPEGGMVPAEQYEQALEANDIMQKSMESVAKDEQQLAQLKACWPYRGREP
ncbi:hypothetical protein K491DRAFT_693946 [Lophiostoma macrostomum CBS 122681]|uniref:Aminoglycoside phosphotransferase domain-containing protein n=1 Tax=Lophiostoma macrostomum CBS 122681 TaxID=1314788 RepID=A0A6A6T3G0_9PLEO|nr:hypothetical protein K491DRAFT_693946 [Lophiostoma macrostomum CBS 122681]